MEVFIEEMVEKKRTAKDILMAFGLMFLSVALCFVLMVVVMPMVPPTLSGIAFLLIFGIFYAAYKLSTSLNVEYEYSLVNTEIDVDKIVNKKTRKRLTTAKITKLESYGVYSENSGEYEKYLADSSVKKIFACDDKNNENRFFIVYMENTVKTMLVFNPSGKIADIITRVNPVKH